jgi:hypothetical protein
LISETIAFCPMQTALKGIDNHSLHILFYRSLLFLISCCYGHIIIEAYMSVNVVLVPMRAWLAMIGCKSISGCCFLPIHGHKSHHQIPLSYLIYMLCYS